MQHNYTGSDVQTDGLVIIQRLHLLIKDLENIATVLVMLGNFGNYFLVLRKKSCILSKAVQKVYRQISASKIAVHKVLQQQLLRRFHLLSVQGIQDADSNTRLDICEWLLNGLIADVNFLGNIFFYTDSFYLGSQLGKITTLIISPSFRAQFCPSSAPGIY